ncbi:hypothetical protein [Pseudocolwellia agarivorans]|uniref:hypothetical protein n=1 Tax=Pseudocolwellia agarivorans TaxID=1911682 RepID=UPI0009864BDA|nr:hypothetical protein [Pseudocolwellia agarivorans]
MEYTEQEIKPASLDLIESFGELLTWRWEEEKNVMLAEFASGKADRVVAILHQKFSHEWNRKSIKLAPDSVKDELGDYAKLIKDQRIFTNTPELDQKSVVALLWPWGHGSTLSLRLTLLETPYEYVEPQPSANVISKFFKKVKSAMA